MTRRGRVLRTLPIAVGAILVLIAVVENDGPYGGFVDEATSLLSSWKNPR